MDPSSLESVTRIVNHHEDRIDELERGMAKLLETEPALQEPVGLTHAEIVEILWIVATATLAIAAVALLVAA